ncbi:hypothetical protein HID58_056676 [Brassica napus]|uniref:TIR domain-containing protein n=1 Tax=Brassica napus TaxID=3708 RepID=A0ABQ8APU3_BRANA|nr:hypothetical protein HID58_056676 [Brassica napus]
MDSSFSLLVICTAAIGFLSILGTLLVVYRKFRSNTQNKTMASSSSSSSSPSPSLPHNWKHHVFPSFHGADVRTNFLSHFVKELRSKGIDLFTDNNIERSESIGPELTEAIKGSRIAIVVLSKNYASWTWCLNELVEIMKCREEFGQTVMSIFYQVEPTHVKKQTGDFGKVFRKTCKGKTKDEIQRWKHALTEVALIAGYHSTNWENEAEMIEVIATDVFNKLNLSAPCSDFDGLVGMESHMVNMGPLLRLDSDEVRKIGIWGPPGIGKTTLARLLFNQCSQVFQLSVFMDNIRTNYPAPACSDDYSVKLDLQKQFMSQLTNDKGIMIPHLGVVKDRLKDKRVLVVLDDVDRSVQLEAIAKETCWFGPGSRIIITTQDQTVLKASRINHLYRVPSPSYSEALEIFSMYAFGQKSPYDGFEKIAREIATLSGELPTGLRFMGSYFRGKSKKMWENELPRLRTSVDGGLGSIIKFTYDALCVEDKERAHHYVSSLPDVELTERMETVLGKGLSEENVNTSERASRGMSSNGLVHTVYIYCADKLQYSFANHLSLDFHRKGIYASVNCNETLDKIEEASGFVVVLSKNYLSSPSCLDKLVKVLQCRRKHVQLVVPVFYGISPSDVAVQEQESDDRIRDWTSALQELRELPGIHSRETEGKMIEDIVAHVSNKLYNSAPSSDFGCLVGIESHMTDMESLLQLDSDDVRRVGILGPPGIGKTTIARSLFNRHSRDFQLSVFMDNIKPEYAKRSVLDLQKQFMSQITSEMGIKIPHLGVAKNRLNDKKVLVVLDDVDQSVQLEAMANETWFSPGSRIVFTTRNQEVLKASGINHLHSVNSPSYNEALQIFCLYAFGQTSPCYGYEKLAQEITTISGELPAGIRFMGSYFRGKSQEEWENELPRLRTRVDGGLRSIMEFTYDALCAEDKKLAHHHISSLSDGLSERIETFSGKENVNTSERASRGMSSNGLPHTVYIYCADTLQYSFASHLSLAFHRKGIYASVNCNETLDKIEEASGFVVVLSKNYLSSPSCLDKLVKALQCRRKHVQLVVPVFYGLSPSDVAVQEQESDDRIRDWISALQELRDLPGILSREESSDCELVKEIVKDVYEKLFPTQQIGVNSRLLEIKQLLCKQPWGIRHIGIWGMPGIGKTTLAKAFFDQLSGRYEASCFITHFDKAFHEKGLYRLWDEHFGKILKDIPGVCSSITRPSLPGEKINKKRTLIVLDDVQNPLVAESFLRGFHWFGPGSLIIVTSRDKRVFRLCQISQVYEVKRLNKNEALQLYSQCAFGKDIEEQKLMELPMEVIDYANGNPLALSFYGEELKGKNLLEPNMIHDLLKSSYETLSDDEKDIFLDIACFFQGDEVDYVKQLLEGCGLFPHVGIDVLVEKCLVTISENRVEMHGIIKDYGREINNKETTWIKRGRRLWGASTIEFLLQDENLEAKGHPEATCKGALVTEDIKAISLDTTNFRFDLNPTAFENMLNLRFLKIYSCNDKSISGVHLPKGLESLPNELRLLHWENYPLQSLPQDFDPGHLVELNMPYSQLQTLWRGTKKLDMLKIARLSHSQQLTEIDDICKAQNIELIDLQGCEKLQSFPATDQLQHLRVVNLSGCSEIRSFPELSPNIEDINLQGTAIRELQISIGDATNLKKLYLSGCSSLVQLPSSIGNASNLQILDLSFCSSLVELPSSIGNATNLEKVNLEYCSSLVELPSSIGNAINLQELNLRYCSSLFELPSSLGIAANLKKLYLSGCSSLMQLPSSIGNAPNLQILDLSNCSSLIELPSSIGDATKLKKLCLRGSSGLVQLPSSIGNAINLQELDLEYCSSLVEIPSSFENATHLKKLYLTGCSSLSPVEEESVYGASASHSWTSDSSRLGEKGKQCFDEIEEENEEEEGSSSQEANEPVSLEEEERLRQELEEIEAKYREEMKEIERKREEALMETKKKLSLVKKTKS